MACGCAGLGLFDSGMDYTQWGWQEWGIVILGGYMVVSTLFTTKRAAKAVYSIPGERRKRRAKSLREEADKLTRKRRSRTKDLF
jgi:hypothetical protein